MFQKREKASIKGSYDANRIMYEETLCKVKRKLSEYKPFILVTI